MQQQVCTNTNVNCGETNLSQLCIGSPLSNSNNKEQENAYKMSVWAELNQELPPVMTNREKDGG